MNDRITKRLETRSVQFVNTNFSIPTQQIYTLMQTAMQIGAFIALEEASLDKVDSSMVDLDDEDQL